MGGLHLGSDLAEPYGLLTWAPPVLTSPRVVTLSNTPSGRQTRDPLNTGTGSLNAPFLDPRVDYIVRCPETITVENGIEINGGRNVVMLGASVNFSEEFASSNGNRALFIKGNSAQTQPRTVHVEGFRMNGILKEGINVDGQSYDGGEQALTVQLQNVQAVSELVGSQAGNHADFVQCYNGPFQLRMDRCFARTTYQGLMLQPHQFGASPLGVYHLKRTYIEGTDASGALLYLVTGQPSDRPTEIITDRVFLRPAASKRSLAQVLLEDPAFWGTGVQLAINGRQGNFVSSYPGLYYQTPGYEAAA